MTQVIVPAAGASETIRVCSMEKDFHVECFSCEECHVALNDEPRSRCYPLGNTLLCCECHVRKIELDTFAKILIENAAENSAIAVSDKQLWMADDNWTIPLSYLSVRFVHVISWVSYSLCKYDELCHEFFYFYKCVYLKQKESALSSLIWQVFTPTSGMFQGQKISLFTKNLQIYFEILKFF